MARTLNLSLRPRSLSALYGQASLVKTIRQQIASGRIPRSWMFIGESGTGKTSIAQVLSIAFQCTHAKLWGDPCEACWKAKDTYSIHEVNASLVNGKEELSQIAKLSYYRPGAGLYRIIILNEAQQISSAAQQMLLDPTENPPATTIWIICTTDPQKLLPALHRRFTKYKLRTLSITEAEAYLKMCAARARIEKPLEPLFEQLHIQQISAPGLLLQALEKYAAGAKASEAVFGSVSEVNSLIVCKAATNGDWDGLKHMLESADAEDARFIRTSVAGWLRGCLLRATSPAEQAKHMQSMLDLTTNVPYDDSVMMQWLWPVLWKICQRYKQ